MVLFILLVFNNISDNKRQQTTTVDYKCLINGFVLTGFAYLQRKTQIYMLWKYQNLSKASQRKKERVLKDVI